MNKFNKTFKMIMESLDNKIDSTDIPDDILSQIHKLINSKCKIGKTSIVYDNKYTWFAEEKEPPCLGFKRNFPNEYEKEVLKFYKQLS